MDDIKIENITNNILKSLSKQNIILYKSKLYQPEILFIHIIIETYNRKIYNKTNSSDR